MAVIETTTNISLPQATIDWFNGDELRARVFYEKYAMRDEEGQQVETTPEQMWRRVAREIASVEKTKEKREEWEEKFHWLLQDFKFVPGGRVLFGAGQSRRATLLNCYFFKIREDSIEAIFDWCKEAARTYSFGGGVGTDISILRPKGAKVNNSAIVSTGAVSFMQIMSETTGTIGQAGRRGALMITINIEHPDVEDFIDVKKDLTRVNHANISVKISDAFMRAVENDETFTLHYENDKTKITRDVRAKDIWNKLVTAARDSAEPGLIFWDTVKRDSTTEYNNMEVEGVNPCSEETLENYGCCCLGSVNLSAFVKAPFTTEATLDWKYLSMALTYATRFLDDVLDYNANKHPLKEQKQASLWSRRIGVGFTGLGDALIKMQLKYDDDKTIEYVDSLFEEAKIAVYNTSAHLAVEKGEFPAFDVKKHLAQPFIQRLPARVQSLIAEKGLRNAAILTIPPVGSGSVLAGTSSGVEPVFAFNYKRRSISLSKGEFQVDHPLIAEYFKMFSGKLPDYFVSAHQIKPEFRVKMQGTIQKHIDTAISSTVNLPTDISVAKVAEIYLNAWKMGCKGITVYREGSRDGILETNEPQFSQCPSCNEKKLIVENGCSHCDSCGWSACST